MLALDSEAILGSMNNADRAVSSQQLKPYAIRQLGRHALVWRTGIATLSLACAPPPSAPEAHRLPDSEGWTVRKIDNGAPPRWVLYERDALEARVKALRIVGVVNATPKAVATALTRRLLDEANVPAGTKGEVLRRSGTEIDIYARSSLPFPFNDREVTERLRVSHDPHTHIYGVDARNIDSGRVPKPGVTRIPLVHNVFLI